MSHGSQRDGLSTFFGLFGRRASRRQSLRVPRLRSAESLERRQMLAADVDLDGVLLITGSEKADKIVISAGAENGTVILRGVPGVAKNAVFTGVNAIVVNARGGNDDIRIGSNIRDVGGNLIGVIVSAGNGNDRVEGGDGDDTFDGGSGNDNLRGRGGNDTMWGGVGNDDISGEAGDDVCFGDTGRDTLRGGSDDDSLSGGANDDKLYGDAGDDSLDGDEGRDKLYGGIGNDDDYDDDDGLKDEDDEDEGENEGGGGDSADATTITFSANAAQVSGLSVGKYDKVFYVFTAPTTGLLSVTLQAGVGGRYADLELEDVLTSVDLLELEPSEGGPAAGSVSVTSGRQYKMRLRSPDLALASYTVDLSIAPAT